MAKNIILILLGLTLIVLVYLQVGSSNKIENLEVKLNETEVELTIQSDSIRTLNDQLDLKEKELKASKALSNNWASKAYKLGYEPGSD